MPDAIEPLDPFDLPEWLGEGEVTWRAESGLRDGFLVEGVLCGPTGADVGQVASIECDLLAVDLAYPQPVVPEEHRMAAHAAWRLGQVLTVLRNGRLTLATPGTHFTADGSLEAIGRLARAVGASPGRYSVSLRIGEA